MLVSLNPGRNAESVSVKINIQSVSPRSIMRDLDFFVFAGVISSLKNKYFKYCLPDDILINNLYSVGVREARQRAWYPCPVHRSRRLIASLLAVYHTTDRTLYIHGRLLTAKHRV